MATVVTKTVKSSGGDYSSLVSWEAAQQGDLTGVRDEIAQTEVFDVNLNEQFFIDGWTTSATQYINIFANAAYAFAGVRDNAKARVYLSNDSPLYISQEYVTVSGIQFDMVTHSANLKTCVTLSAGNTTFSRCAFIASSTADTHSSKAFYSIASSGTVNILNCLILNNGTQTNGSHGLHTNGAATYNIYSSNIILTNAVGYYGFYRQSGTIVVKNSYICSVGGWPSTGTTKTTSGSSDASTGTAANLRSIALNTTNFTDVTVGAENFHLPSGSALVGKGTDTSGESAPLNFTVDVDGQTRGATWDVGYDQYVAAAAGGAAIFNPYDEVVI